MLRSLKEINKLNRLQKKLSGKKSPPRRFFVTLNWLPTCLRCLCITDMEPH